MTDQKTPQDTIALSLSVEQTVVNDTIKVVAEVHAMVGAGEAASDESLRQEIRTMMRRFIDSEWIFSNTEREADPTGLEKMSLLATTRVKESENHAITKRAKDASRAGLTIGTVNVDTSIPPAMIDAAEQEMRGRLLEKALAEAALMQGISKRPYRVHRLNFSTVNRNIGNSNNSLRGGMALSTKSSGSYGSGFGDSEESLGNAQKLTMQAEVVLAVDANL